MISFAGKLKVFHHGIIGTLLHRDTESMEDSRAVQSMASQGEARKVEAGERFGPAHRLINKG